MLYGCCEGYVVATVPTACGIETFCDLRLSLGTTAVATVPTACGIETLQLVATVSLKPAPRCNSTYRLRY